MAHRAGERTLARRAASWLGTTAAAAFVYWWEPSARLKGRAGSRALWGGHGIMMASAAPATTDIVAMV
eukprot:8418254-Pyramimonas_sp.AAC.1